MKWNEVEEKLSNQGLIVFSSLELKRATGLSSTAAKFLLIRAIKNGLIFQLKQRRGLYCLKKITPHPWFLANKLLKPSYISLESALSFYGALPETVFGVSSITPRPTKSLESLNRVFDYHTIKPSAFTGYGPITIQDQTVLIAEKEKALADYLYFVHLGKKVLNDRLRWSVFSEKKTLAYLNLFHRKKLIERTQYAFANSH